MIGYDVACRSLYIQNTSGGLRRVIGEVKHMVDRRYNCVESAIDSI